MMKENKVIINPKYSELVRLFDQLFENKVINQTELVYSTTLRFKLNLRFESTIEFPTQLTLKENENKTLIEARVQLMKIYVLSFIIFGLISIIRYFIKPDFYALIFGIISGFIVYFIAKQQVKIALEKYLKDLLSKS